MRRIAVTLHGVLQKTVCMDPLPNCGGRVDFLDTEAFRSLLLRYRPNRNYRELRQKSSTIGAMPRRFVRELDRPCVGTRENDIDWCAAKCFSIYLEIARVAAVLQATRAESGDRKLWVSSISRTAHMIKMNLIFRLPLADGGCLNCKSFHLFDEHNLLKINL